MAYLADTNVADRRVLPADPQYQSVCDAIDRLRWQGAALYITPQVLVEFHALATRPTEANGWINSETRTVEWMESSTSRCLGNCVTNLG